MGKRDFEDATVELDDNGEPVIRVPYEWRFLDIRKAFEEDPPQLDFVLPGLLAGTVGSLVAPGSVGKSFFALEAGIAVAIGGRPGFDLLDLGDVKKGRVLILAAEDPDAILETRMHAIGQHLSNDVREDVYKNMTIVPCLGQGIDITANHWQADLISLIGQVRPRLVFIDTLTRVHSKDENAAQDAKIIMSALEKIAHEMECAIVFLHHVSKAAALNGMADLQQAARGSSVFVDNSRWQSYLAVMSAEEAKAAGIDEDRRMRYVRWNVPKMNYGAAFPDRWFRRGEGGVIMAKGAEDIDVTEKPAKKTKRTKYKGGA